MLTMRPYPCSATVSSTSRLTCSSLETSTCLLVPSWMSALTTVAPSSASLSADALPIPCAAPVTIATRLSSLPMCAPVLCLVVTRRVRVALPRLHVVREEDLRTPLLGELFDARDRADAVDRCVV